jgi:hypothetical protein
MLDLLMRTRRRTRMARQRTSSHSSILSRSSKPSVPARLLLLSPPSRLLLSLSTSSPANSSPTHAVPRRRQLEVDGRLLKLERLRVRFGRGAIDASSGCSRLTLLGDELALDHVELGWSVVARSSTVLHTLLTSVRIRREAGIKEGRLLAGRDRVDVHLRRVAVWARSGVWVERRRALEMGRGCGRTSPVERQGWSTLELWWRMRRFLVRWKMGLRTVGGRAMRVLSVHRLLLLLLLLLLESHTRTARVDSSHRRGLRLRWRLMSDENNGRWSFGRLLSGELRGVKMGGIGGKRREIAVFEQGETDSKVSDDEHQWMRGSKRLVKELRKSKWTNLSSKSSTMTLSSSSSPCIPIPTPTTPASLSYLHRSLTLRPYSSFSVDFSSTGFDSRTPSMLVDTASSSSTLSLFGPVGSDDHSSGKRQSSKGSPFSLLRSSLQDGAGIPRGLEPADDRVSTRRSSRMIPPRPRRRRKDEERRGSGERMEDVEEVGDVVVVGVVVVVGWGIGVNSGTRGRKRRRGAGVMSGW